MTRAPRSDAVRNRATILAAARDQITAHGPDVGMDAIAAAAGVAVGTLYRHFATKADLVTAVLDEYLEAVTADAEAAAAGVGAGASPGDELTAFIRRVIDASSANRAAKAAAESLGASTGRRDLEGRTLRAIGVVLQRGHDDGTVPAGVTVEDVYLVVLTAPYDQPPAARERWLELMLAGLLTP